MAVIGGGRGCLGVHAATAAGFMGGTGSLALGGALGAVGVAAHHECVLVIVGGLFVLEAVSVVVQVFWFKRYGKRVFKMAPIHHHFEKKGWPEPKITEAGRRRAPNNGAMIFPLEMLATASAGQSTARNR